MADDASDDPASPRMEDMVAMASPGGDFASRQVLANLEAKLFNRRRDPVHVGRYIIERRLGAGGSGTVYCAYDPQKDRNVALKLLHASEGARQEAAQARLLREAQTLTKIDHPNVVKVHDVGTYDASVFDPPGLAKKTTDPGVYVAMEFIDGVNLDTWLRQHTRPWQEVRDVYVQAGRGLTGAHAKGLIHRDFKPANVLVSLKDDGTVSRVVVLDFGLARATDKLVGSSHYGLGEDAREHLKKAAAPIDATLTAPGTLLGTPAYMAPEQHARGRGTALSDQYSFCLTLYEAWYGHRPFFAETERALEEAKFAGDVMPPPADTDVPPYLFAAVQRGMSADPNERYPSMEALLEALTARPPSRNRWWAVGALATATAGVATWLSWPAHPCGSTTTPVHTHWDQAQRAQVVKALGSVDVPYARQTAKRSAQRLDAFAETWLQAHRQACGVETQREPGEQRVCLLRRGQTFAALVDALNERTPVNFEHVVAATASLRSPRDCIEATPPWDVAGAPGSREAEALSLAQAALWLGDAEVAVEAAARAQRAASETGDAHATTVAALLGATATADAGRLDAAVKALADVLWSASGVHQRGLAAAAANELVERTPSLSEPHPDAPLWAQRARDTATKGDIHQRVRTLAALGRAMLATGHHVRAVEDLSAARDLLRGSESDPGPLHVIVMRTLGEAWVARGDAEHATEPLRHAVNLAGTVFGDAHPQSGRALRALADALAATDATSEAATVRAKADAIAGDSPVSPPR